MEDLKSKRLYKDETRLNNKCATKKLLDPGTLSHSFIYIY